VVTKNINWRDTQNAKLQIIVQTTSIHQIEEERANQKYSTVMLSSISHELRTPLNAIMQGFSYIENGLRKPDEINFEVMQKMIMMGKVSSELLMSMVRDIVDFG